MIYVRRDPALIPEGVLKVAERAQAALELLPYEQRAAYIKKKSYIWRSFKKYLRKMSYGKCWYSEANDPQSIFDVDHFRPKSEARRSETEFDDGYPWLAFSWDNFRYSAGRSNKLTTDEDTDEVVGKSSWFPLIEGSAKASWDDRCVKDEKSMLLDPTNEDDVKLVEIAPDGRVSPNKYCVGTNRLRVAASVKRYGLDLPNVKEERLRVMRDVSERIDALLRCIEAAKKFEPAADHLPIPEQRNAITNLTLPSRTYSLAARSKLCELGLGDLIAKPEGQAAIAT